jgi:hypothetical protein
MANFKIPINDEYIELNKSSETTVTLNTKDTYVREDIDVVVKPHIGSFNNQPSGDTTYTEVTSDATVIPSGGYLYLNQGWFENTKISLSHLIPEIADNDAGVSHILSGYKAYDEKGSVITGTMATVDPKFDGGTITVTPSVNSLTKPAVTVSSSGTFTTATNYGVTTTAPSTSGDGTNYLTIDGKASITKGSVKASATATTTAVLYNGAYTGYLNKSDNTQALAAGSKTNTSSASDIDVTLTDSFAPLYIPIVSVSGKGGGLSKATTGNSLSITGTNPTVTLSYGGSFTKVSTGDIGTSYGVTTTAPSTGTDGADFLKVEIGGSSNTQTFTGSATINVNRAAVTNNGLKQGAINIADGASLLGATSQSFTHTNSLSVSANLSNEKSYYIPIIKSMPVTGGGMTQGTSSVNVTGTAPNVTISKTGKFTDVGSGGVGASYGVTTTAPSTGTDGTNFLKIEIGGSSNTQTFTGSASIAVSRAKVIHKTAAAGAIKWKEQDTILDSGSSTFTSNGTTDVTASISGGTTYYIPIVNLTDKGTGGSVTASASADVSIAQPKVDYTTTGSVVTDAQALGISHSPFDGEDGDGYYSLSIKPTITSEGTVSGTVSGTWNRTAVKSNNVYQGAVNLTTSTQFLASGSGRFDGTRITATNIGVDFSLVTKDDKDWYFKRAQLSSDGGGLETATLSVTGTAPTVTPDINFLSRSGSTDGTAITVADYGITTTAPTTGNWVVFDPTGSSNTQTFTGSVTAARGALTLSVSNGLTTGENVIVDRETKTYSGTKTVKATVANGTNRYIPVQSVSASVSSHSITYPTVNYSESATYYVKGVKQSSLPSGIILAQTSNPSDFDREEYIKISPSSDVTQGSSKTTAKGTISAGITTGGEATSAESSKAVSVNHGTTKSCFIKVYDYSYTVS